MQIGELFILRINIHLQGSVLDAPELMWAEPQLDPVYQAVRSYLEMDQRVSLLTERLDVIADLLQVLKDQLTHTHGEYLEWIVIVLIAAEVCWLYPIFALTLLTLCRSLSHASTSLLICTLAKNEILETEMLDSEAFLCQPVRLSFRQGRVYLLETYRNATEIPIVLQMCYTIE